MKMSSKILASAIISILLILPLSTSLSGKLEETDTQYWLKEFDYRLKYEPIEVAKRLAELAQLKGDNAIAGDLLKNCSKIREDLNKEYKKILAEKEGLKQENNRLRNQLAKANTSSNARYNVNQTYSPESQDCLTHFEPIIPNRFYSLDFNSSYRLGWSIQLGSFKELCAAVGEAEKLQDEFPNESFFIFPKTVKNQSHYAITINQYPSQEEAKNGLRQLKRLKSTRKLVKNSFTIGNNLEAVRI